MFVLTEDVQRLFNKVIEEISRNIRELMEELWLNWNHLGVDDQSKTNFINKLVQIEKDLHSDVVSETRQKLKNMQAQVEKLKKETEELSRCLSVDITILEFNDDMMLVDYKRELEQQISGYREQLEQRRTNIDRLMEWQSDLADKLGVSLQKLREVPLPSEEELERLKDHLTVLQAERDKRVETFLHAQIEIKELMDKLQIKPQNKFEQTAVTSLSVDFKVTDFNMDRLAKLQQDLQENYEQTNNRVLELRERLIKLWECLDEDQIYRENFLHAHPGCHPHTEAAVKDEIRRCEQMKREKIGVFVANMRTKIKLMWDNVMYSTQERQKFVHYYQDIFTEDTLTLHELHLEKITKHYNDHKNIFDLVVNRKNLWLKMTELEARASEPGRYQNRGGQLLKEEKERKAIASNLPKIEAQIRELVGQYEARTGITFTVNGKPLLKLIEDEWENRKAERQNKLSARKQANTPTTPLLRSHAVSPLGKRNRTAAGLAGGSEKRPQTKRQLITGSASKAITTITNMSARTRSAISTVKRRISGRLVARGVPDNQNAKRKLDYGGEPIKTPTVTSHILKRKRTSQSKRKSGGGKSNGRKSGSRKSVNATRSTDSHDEQEQMDPARGDQEQRQQLMETTTYTDFQERINHKQDGRSSMYSEINTQKSTIPKIVCDTDTNGTPNKTPRTQMTPKMGQKNTQHMNLLLTPRNNLMSTPKRLTRSADKLNNDGFATPRAPLSSSKMNRQNTDLRLAPNISRSKSHTNLVRAKNLPPLI